MRSVSKKVGKWSGLAVLLIVGAVWAGHSGPITNWSQLFGDSRYSNVKIVACYFGHEIDGVLEECKKVCIPPGRPRDEMTAERALEIWGTVGFEAGTPHPGLDYAYLVMRDCAGRPVQEVKVRLGLGGPPGPTSAEVRLLGTYERGLPIVLTTRPDDAGPGKKVHLLYWPPGGSLEVALESEVE